MLLLGLRVVGKRFECLGRFVFFLFFLFKINIGFFNMKKFELFIVRLDFCKESFMFRRFSNLFNFLVDILFFYRII